MIYILDVEGNLVKGFRSHSASILDLDIDSSSEFVASASIDGELPCSASTPLVASIDLAYLFIRHGVHLCAIDLGAIRL